MRKAALLQACMAPHVMRSLPTVPSMAAETWGRRLEVHSTSLALTTAEKQVVSIMVVMSRGRDVLARRKRQQRLSLQRMMRLGHSRALKSGSPTRIPRECIPLTWMPYACLQSMDDAGSIGFSIGFSFVQQVSMSHAWSTRHTVYT